MAKQMVTQYTDDLDGSKAQGTVRFAFEGAAYEIDLSAKNTRAFEKALTPYIDAARKVRAGAVRTSRRGRSSKASTRTNLADVRSWAQSNGYAVATRGRIPAAVIEAFEQSR
jgi:hypothetical protein